MTFLPSFKCPPLAGIFYFVLFRFEINDGNYADYYCEEEWMNDDDFVGISFMWKDWRRRMLGTTVGSVGGRVSFTESWQDGEQDANSALTELDKGNVFSS